MNKLGSHRIILINIVADDLSALWISRILLLEIEEGLVVGFT